MIDNEMKNIKSLREKNDLFRKNTLEKIRSNKFLEVEGSNGLRTPCSYGIIITEKNELYKYIDFLWNSESKVEIMKILSTDEMKEIRLFIKNEIIGKKFEFLHIFDWSCIVDLNYNGNIIKIENNIEIYEKTQKFLEKFYLVEEYQNKLNKLLEEEPKSKNFIHMSQYLKDVYEKGIIINDENDIYEYGIYHSEQNNCYMNKIRKLNNKEIKKIRKFIKKKILKKKLEEELGNEAIFRMEITYEKKFIRIQNNKSLYLKLKSLIESSNKNNSIFLKIFH